MASTIVHSYFAKDLYDILPSEIVEKVNLQRLKMFSQSTDSLMFYNLFSLLPGKKIRKLQHYFHSHDTNKFFINLLSFVKNHDIDDSDTYSFIIGFICHYVLDSTVHPYIIYKTGIFYKNKPSTYKYNNVHHFMEIFLDNDMVRRREKINPYKFSVSKFCFDTRKFSRKLENTIDYSFYNTFNIRGMGDKYYKSLKQMKLYLRLFRRDSYGIKKVIYKLIDTITPRSCFRFEAISYHYPLEDKHNFLNSNHTLWRNPCDYDVTSTESFVDLYVKAIEIARDMIIETFNYLNGEDVDLNNLFGNKSYFTGFSLDKNQELKYFEF
ncbi:MAG: zinc dependent phospholipase C family protein [Bacilli bacterium]|nr:zinc dependent phospholipase C family protein [Bacilli bacterium]